MKTLLVLNSLGTEQDFIDVHHLGVVDNKTVTALQNKVFGDSEHGHTVILSKETARNLQIKLIKFLNEGDPNGLFKTEKHIEELIKVTCEFFMISEKEIHVKTRKQDIVAARHLIYTILVVHKYGSLGRIADIFNQDHATAIHAKKSIYDYVITKNKMYYNKIKSVLDYYGIDKLMGIKLT